MGSRGPQPSYKLTKMKALHLANILSDLTPQRVGGNAEFLFLSAIVKEINDTFCDSEPPRNLTVSESGASDYGRRINGGGVPHASL